MRDIKDHPLQNGLWFSSYNLRAKIFEQLVHKDVQGFAQGTWDGGVMDTWEFSTEKRWPWMSPASLV